MSANITYMGTKRALAPIVAEVIAQTQPGVMLDAFSGMCSVGERIGPARQVWNNDAQVFAATVARSLFTSGEISLSPTEFATRYYSKYKSTKKALQKKLVNSIALEEALFETASFDAYSKIQKKLDRKLSEEARKLPKTIPHLFSLTYANNFFGICQSIEIDSIIASLNHEKRDAQIAMDSFRWGLVALGRTLLRSANSTGHFAQYLKPNERTYLRSIKTKKKSVWNQWIESIGLLSPVGTPSWRKNNKVFNENSLDLIPRLSRQNTALSVVYADPPYTDDQYSRFYHILETLCLYDYPNTTGAGLYRGNRFRTPFSVKSLAPKALSQFIDSVSLTGADLVLSYPANGLATTLGFDIKIALKKKYKRVEIARALPHKHSTFGASKGMATSAATEFLYLARST